MKKANTVIVHGIEHTQIPTFELETLQENSRKLLALEAAGVENWEGYEYAQSLIDYPKDDAVKTPEVAE